MRKKKRSSGFQNDIIRVLQIAGISLVTLGFLNSVFLDYISLAINILLILCGLGLLWCSYKLWRLFRGVSRRQQQYRHKPQRPRYRHPSGRLMNPWIST